MDYTLLQTEKRHDIDRLVDAFVAAQIPPLIAKVTPEGDSRFRFAEGVTLAQVQAAVSGYTYSAPAAPPDLRALFQAYRASVNATNAPAALKAALVEDLGRILKALAKGIRGNMDD